MAYGVQADENRFAAYTCITPEIAAALPVTD